MNWQVIRLTQVLSLTANVVVLLIIAFVNWSWPDIWPGNWSTPGRGAYVFWFLFCQVMCGLLASALVEERKYGI